MHGAPPAPEAVTPLSGRHTYRLTRDQIFGCYFLRIFWRLMAASTFLFFVPTVGAMFVFYFKGLVEPDTVMLTAIGVTIGLEAPLLIFFVLRAHFQSKNAPPLPAGETTLEWSPHYLRATGETYNSVYAWEDVTRHKGHGDKIILSFPDDRCTGIYPENTPEPLRRSLLAAMKTRKEF